MRSAEKAPTTRAWKRLRSVSICVCIYIVSLLALLVQKYKGADNARLEAASKRQYLCVCIYSQFTCFTSTKVQNLEAASKRRI